jgi:hypothetical protein
VITVKEEEKMKAAAPSSLTGALDHKDIKKPRIFGTMQERWRYKHLDTAATKNGAIIDKDKEGTSY